MKRVAIMSAAAILSCCGLVFAQPADKPASDAPAKKEVVAPAKKETQSGKKLEFGDAAPALNVEKWVKGEPVTGFEKGKTYIVEFWATWCGPCKASMPHLSELQKQYKSKGLTVIGVASPGWRDELADVEKMVSDKGDTMGYAVCWDKEVPQEGKDVKKGARQGFTNDAYMKAAKQRGIPTSFVIDSKGNVAWYGHPMQLDYVLDDILAGKWDYKEGPAKIEEMFETYRKLMDDADNDPKAVLKGLNDFEAKYPKMAKELPRSKYMLQVQAGMFDDAAKTGEKVIEQMVEQKDFQGLNQLAWQIVDPEGDIRGKHNLDLAMKAAQKAVDLTSEKDGAILDTLARCYWIKGDKVKAVDLQKKAISVLTKDQADSKDQLEATLKEYQGGAN